MFNNLANYLLGSFLNQDQPATATPLNDEGVESNNHLRLTPADDWLLVDRDSEGNSEVSSVEDIDDDIDELSTNNYNATALLPYTASTNIMDESWFVTPPPCFISTEPVHMETSPLENLLIEHPSMSVYTHHLRRHHNIVLPVLRNVSPPPAPHQQFDDDDIVEEEVVDHIIVHRRVNTMQMLQQQEMQGLKCRQAQKMQVQRAGQYMKRNYLERNNKAREVNSRNQRQRRGERSQGAVRSYANNNRKC